MEWFIQNKEWLLSGIAVAIPIAIIGWLLNKRSRSVNQKQQSGHRSTNIQIGGDIRIDPGKGKKDD